MADPTASLAEQYKAYVKLEQQLDRITKITTGLAQLVVDSEDSTEREKEYYADLLPATLAEQTDRQEALTKCELVLAESEIVRNSREDKLEIPDDRETTNPDLNVKDLKSFVGILDQSSSSNIKAFFCRLFQYGKTCNYSHENYKAALAACFQGTLLDQYFALCKTDMTFTALAEWFYQVYYRPNNLRTFENEMKHFQRLAGEPLDVFMKRFEVIAQQADALLPSNQAYYTTDRHKLKIIEKIIQNPAKLEYLKWRGTQDDGGLAYSFEKSVKQATDYEAFANCLPTSAINIDTLDVVTDLSALQLNSSTPASEANPAIKGRRHTSQAKNNTNPYGKGKNPNIDPQRAGGPRASFYPSRSQSEPRQSAPASGTTKGDAYRPSMSRGFKFSSRGNSRGRGGFRGSRGHFKPGNRGGRAPSEPAQYSYSNPSDYKNPPQQFSYRGNRGGNSGNRGSYRNSRGNFNNNRGQNPVRKNWFCLKCGVYPDIEKTKRVGSTHTTKFCPIYKHWNNEFCSYCLGHKGLRANHYPKHCLQIPPSNNNIDVTERTDL